ncbi:hypothetical protein HAV15_010488 [Penicillium sp. str. |nr:hypothetical protein HAV15_010488 [Penicillium sp. str. \
MMSTWAFLIIFALIIPLLFLFTPPRHPREIPSVPFWVTLLPVLFDIDQQQIFEQYIATRLYRHGAIKLFFAGQWNIIVERPEFISEVLKREQIYNKSGNQKKIPHSVLADFLETETGDHVLAAGSNIISARGEEWRCYRTIIKPGLQKVIDTKPIIDNARKLRETFRQMQGKSIQKGIPIQEILQRYSSANLLCCIFDCPELGRYLFRPIFMNFPVLDRLASVIPSRAKARRLIRQFSELLQAEVIPSSGKKLQNGENENCLGDRLRSAWRDGTLKTKQLRDNLNVLYVAGQENPQLLMVSSLYLLGKHSEIQEYLREKINDLSISNLDDLDWRSLPYLTATILECLRLLPPISQLVNRHVAEPACLGGRIHIPRGTYIGYNSYATNRDPVAWGPDANNFRPERWGSTDEQISRKYRSAKARAEFISFHGGSRACLGEKFALLQMRVSLFVLARTFRWELDPEWKDQMTPAGPLHPRGVRLVFIKL